MSGSRTTSSSKPSRVAMQCSAGTNGEERRAVVESIEEQERLVLHFDDDGYVELALEDVLGGTLVRVRETAPSFGVALEMQACVAWATA